MASVVVANLDDLEVGDTMLVDELREPIGLIRLDDDDVRAIHNTCTHQQQPLHEGTLQDDDTLVCAAHASRYDLSTGEAVGVFACGPIPVYACKIEDDAIFVDIDQQLNDAPLPRPPAPGSLGARYRRAGRGPGRPARPGRRCADSRAARGAGDVTFNFNSELYADPSLVEGVDYARRYRRHERFDDTLARTDDVPKTAILAPHGGGIEPGTSELCLAVAGYHPAALPQIPAAGVTYDYWMFEGMRERGNAALHVTAAGCDDGVAVSLCAGSLNALALHGFRPGPPDMSEDDQVVLVGGGNTTLRGYLL